MRNLTMREWAVAFAVLIMLTVLAAVSDVLAFSLAVQFGWFGLVAERAHNLGRVQAENRFVRELVRCGQNPLGDAEHGCVRLAAEPHTLHRCGHGDCSWGY
jgi:hypothetical protein